MAPKSVSITFVFLINAITALVRTFIPHSHIRVHIHVSPMCMQAYLIMVLTDTSFILWCGGDRSFDWLRYAAWGTVAPLTIALLATVSRVPTGQAVFTAVLSFVAVLALFAAAVSPICVSAWPLFAFAIAAGIVIATQLLTNFRAAACANLPASITSLFSTYVWGLILLFAAYAIVWGTAEGGKAADATQEIITYTVLDIMTKVVLNAFLLLGVRSYNQYGSCTAWMGTGELDFAIKSA
jgi:bacteriorhodopsin